jgi:hypothetical protein
MSEDPKERLGVINELIKKWVTRRMDAMHLPDADRKQLVSELEKKRKEGMDRLEEYRKSKDESVSVAIMAPAYVDIDECAVCNGAVGKSMKLPEKK